MKFRSAFGVAITLAFGLTPMATSAEPQSGGPDTVPITTVVAAVAKRSGKKFIVDPRVSGDALLLQESPATLSYDGLLALLHVHGFAAITTGEYVRVVPDALVRQMALPVASGDKHAQGEYVTRVLSVNSIPAAQLVPMLRPMVPQHGHLVALPCTNNLIIVDTYGNIQRLEQVIKALDRGETYVPEKCKHVELPPRAMDKPGDKSNNR